MTSMNMTTYLEASGRTAAGTLHGHTIRASDMEAILQENVASLKRLDQVKKALFYGREPSWGIPKTNHEPVEVDDVRKDIFHAVIGIATEAGELLELLLDPEKATKAKLTDEGGDVLWYLALLFRTIGTTFDAAGERNIQKLAIRFPDKFEEYLAIDKDDDKEKVVFQ